MSPLKPSMIRNTDKTKVFYTQVLIGVNTEPFSNNGYSVRLYHELQVVNSRKLPDHSPSLFRWLALALANLVENHEERKRRENCIPFQQYEPLH